MSTCVYTCQFKLMLYTQFVLFAMDADKESAAAAVVIGVLLKRRKSKERKKRSVWVKPWLQRRNKLGVYHTLLQELRMEAEEEYKQLLRMSPELFDELLILVKPEIEKETTILRDPIPSALKLASVTCQPVVITRICNTFFVYTKVLYQSLSRKCVKLSSDD